MEQKSSFWAVVIAVILTAVIVGGGMYYLNKMDEAPIVQNTETNDETDTPVVSEKTFMDYYTNRDQFSTPRNETGGKTPSELGFKEIAKIEIACPENADGPCGGFLEILSKTDLSSGDQEFYFGEAGGAGYSYYGPFTDNLSRIVNEAKESEPLKQIY